MDNFMAIGTQDIQSTFDLTAETEVSAADIVQETDTAQPANDRGLIIWSQDSALNTPVVPQAQTTTRYQRYIWIRIPHSTATDKNPKVYFWAPYATSVATYLKWTEMSELMEILVPTELPPNGPAGGDLTGEYPNPTIGANKVTASKLSSSATDNSVRAVGENHVKDGAITTNKIGAQAVTGVKVADFTLAATKLDSDSRNTVHQYAAGTFNTGVYSVNLTTPPSSYTTGMVVRFKASAVNTGATKINVNSLGEKDIFKGPATELAAGDIPQDAIVELVYDGTQFQLQTTPATISNGFTSGEFSIVNGLIANTPHGLGATPKRVRWVLVFKSAVLGYSIDDEIDITGATVAGNPIVTFTGGANYSNVFLLKYFSGTNLQVVDRSTGNFAFLPSISNVKAKCYAFLS